MLAGVHMLCRHVHDFHGILTKVANILFLSHTVGLKIMQRAILFYARVKVLNDVCFPDLIVLFTQVYCIQF